ncbi:NrdR family transcriptional regulator [Methylorubrum thiocyanatum]|uniref:NrdR family transcriptional regulator n=1 Tax=Methylorubrum thiocyanatum TaxID=47958 RepID=UPI0035C7A817
MICPKCSADTRVIDSRPEMGGKVIRRRRICVAVGCAHDFDSYESTLNVVARRQREAAGMRAYRRADPERAREQDRQKSKSRALRVSAEAEAAETGQPLADVLRAWDIKPAARAKPASRPHRRPTPRCNEGSATTPNLDRTR